MRQTLSKLRMIARRISLNVCYESWDLENLKRLVYEDKKLHVMYSYLHVTLRRPNGRVEEKTVLLDIMVQAFKEDGLTKIVGYFQEYCPRRMLD